MIKKTSKIFKVGLADNKTLNVMSEIFKPSMLYHVPVFVVNDDAKQNYYYEDGYFNYKEHSQPVDGYIAEDNNISQNGDYIIGEITLFNDKEIIGEFINYEIEVLDYEDKDGVSYIKDMNIKTIYVK